MLVNEVTVLFATTTADSSRGRRSSSQLAMSRESSAGEPKVRSDQPCAATFL